MSKDTNSTVIESRQPRSMTTRTLAFCALLAALNSGKVRGAGLDVFESEPTPNCDLYNHPNVSCTPHIGAATVEAQKRIGAEIVDIITTFFN